MYVLEVNYMSTLTQSYVLGLLFLMLASICSMVNTFYMVWVVALSCEQIVYIFTSI